MSQSIAFYANAVPLSRERHRDVHVAQGEGYAFARSINAVPLTLVEFPQAALEYPIVIAGEGETLAPFAVLGIEDRQNLFIDERGGWDGRYIPAFVRRYPFVFARSEDGRNFTVCIDEAFVGVNREGKGEALFDAEGERTPYLEKVLAFLGEYQRQHVRSHQLCVRLEALELLEPMQARLSMPGGRRFGLSGFRVVNRERLRRLAAVDLEKLARNDELELVHAHLLSLLNFDRMVGRLAAAHGDAGGQPPPAAD